MKSFYKSLSLKTKLLLWVMPIVITGLLSISFAAYWYIKNTIEVELSESMLSSVGKSAESINRWLTTIMLEPETTAATPVAKNINEDFASLDLLNINRHKILHQKYADIFQDIYAANRKGEYHTILKKDGEFVIFTGDISNRPYFQSIMAGGQTQLTPPLISRTTGIPTVFLVSPILDDMGQPQGLIGAGISLKYIQKITENLKAGKSGYSFMLSQDGLYIYHPSDEIIMQDNILQFSDSSMRSLGAQMLAGESGMLSLSLHGVAMVAFYKPIPVAGWSVATVLPEDELFAPAIRMVKLLASITLVFIILVGLAILQTMKILTRPLGDLASSAKELSAGNLDMVALKVESYDELGQLSQAFNIMTANLKANLLGLRKSEDKYRSIFENSLLGISQSSPEGEFLNANPAMLNMLGYTSFKLLSVAITDIGRQLYVNPEDRKDILALLMKQGKVKRRVVQFYRRDGNKIWVIMNITLVRNSLGEPIRIESLVTDITARKEAEAERKVLEDQLMQAQKLEAVGQLAGGVAHDFNNMLSVIIGKSELALMKMTESDPFHDSFTEIKKAADHSANLTRQLLTFARKEAVAPQVIDLNSVLSEMVTMVRRIIGEDIELVQSPLSGLWPVKIDPHQGGQILANLCVNARDAIDGVGRIGIETHNVSFDEAYCEKFPQHQPGDYVCLSVSDDGCGIDKSVQKHIFEPFFTTKEIHKGTGLGLATVYGIVKQNGGHITIYSEPGHGSVFKLFFPRYTGDVNLEGQGNFRQELVSGDETILLVEDELPLLQVTRTMLEELGYKVLSGNTPEEAISLAKIYSGKIDLLLTDVVMPKMNGRDLATRLSLTQPKMKCLFMSGYTANIITNQDVLQEELHFLQKPFSIQILCHRIREILDTKA